MNPALRDQYDAAVEHNKRLHKETAHRRGMREVECPVIDDLTQRFRDVILGPDILGCIHANTPQPLTLAYYIKPWALVCQDCLIRHVYWYRAEPDFERLDKTCDYCGTHDPEGLHVGQSTHGLVTVLYGLCETCTGPFVDKEI